MNAVKILNISIDNLYLNDLLKRLKLGGIVFTPNVDHLVKLQKDPEFYEVYKIADYITCDSQILKYISIFLGSPIQEKISGSDLFPAFYKYYGDDSEVTIFLLGAAAGVAEIARDKINVKVGREMVIDTYSPPFGFEKDEQECNYIINRINESGATVLAVGVGAPKQEKWIYKYRHKMPRVKVFLAIGATIDFEAGQKQRSPKWMSKLGIEWLHRLLSEPQRLWKRYLVDSIPFFILIVKQKLNLYRYQRVIGQVLQDAELLSLDQVEKAIAIKQKYPQQRFGSIVVEQGWLRQDTVDFFVELLPQLRNPKERYPLGQYLKLAGLIDEEQIASILREQEYTGLLFGEVAVGQGWVKQGTIDVISSYVNPIQR